MLIVRYYTEYICKYRVRINKKLKHSNLSNLSSVQVVFLRNYLLSKGIFVKQSQLFQLESNYNSNKYFHNFNFQEHICVMQQILGTMVKCEQNNVKVDLSIWWNLWGPCKWTVWFDVIYVKRCDVIHFHTSTLIMVQWSKV